MSEIEMTTLTLKAEPDVVAKLDQMVRDEDSDRSKFIRKLIREEALRRNGHKLDPCAEEGEKQP
jgi:metal-responsive CopG/Arc/MetJ family transcriptional regulator